MNAPRNTRYVHESYSLYSVCSNGNVSNFGGLALGGAVGKTARERSKTIGLANVAQRRQRNARRLGCHNTANVLREQMVGDMQDARSRGALRRRVLALKST